MYKTLYTRPGCCNRQATDITEREAFIQKHIILKSFKSGSKSYELYEGNLWFCIIYTGRGITLQSALISEERSKNSNCYYLLWSHCLDKFYSVLEYMKLCWNPCPNREQWTKIAKEKNRRKGEIIVSIKVQSLC